MKISELAVHNNIATWVGIILLLLIGMVALSSMPLDLFPELNYPTAVVVTEYSGATPEEVMHSVTKLLEEALSTVDHVKSVSSISQPGMSTVMVELDWGTDASYAALKMRERIDRIGKYLPPEAEKPQVLETDLSDLPVMQVGVAAEGLPLSALKTIADDLIKPALERVPGVAAVNVMGGLEREIHVDVDPFRLYNYNLSLQQLVEGLRYGNVSTASGRIATGGIEPLVDLKGRWQKPGDIAETAIFTPLGSQIKLKDLAEVRDTYADPSQIVRLNGQPAVSLAIRKQSGANTVLVSVAVNRAMDRLKQELPHSVTMTTVLDQAKFVRWSLNYVASTGVQGGILAILILLLLLGDFRRTLIISVAIPLSLVAAFGLLYFSGQTLNVLSLSGLALGVGMMVDNAIVILENIHRHSSEGRSPLGSAISGTAEVDKAVTASTLTSIVVFFPIVFMTGMASQLFSPLALSVSFSLLASLATALTFVPMLAARIPPAARRGEGKARQKLLFFRWIDRAMDGLQSVYEKTICLALDHRPVVITLAVAFLASGLGLANYMGMELIPDMDFGELMVDVELPSGTSIETTDRVVREMEAAIKSLPEVQDVLITVGSAGGLLPGDSQSNSHLAKMDVKLVRINDRDKRVSEIAEELRQKLGGIPGTKVTVTPGGALVTTFTGLLGGGSGAPVQVAIQGEDGAHLEQLASRVMQQVERVPGTRGVKASVNQGLPQLSATLDHDRASSFSLNSAMVTQAVHIAMEGQVATRLRQGDQETDVLVRLDKKYRDSASDLENLLVTTATGSTIPLKEVARIERTQGPADIARHEQQRAVYVSAELQGRSLGSVVQDIKARLAGLNIPAGYTIQVEGEYDQMQETFSEFGKALLLALVLVYLLLAVQFNSWHEPLVIMFSVPLVVPGAVSGLLLLGSTLNIASFIGLIMLAGIVVNNAIVLVDYVKTLRAKGYAKRDAITRGGTTRLRPILMTTSTTVLGILPVALGTGEGSEVSASLAIVVVGGLLSSTLVTLVLVPVVYSLMDEIAQWLQRQKIGHRLKFLLPGSERMEFDREL